MPPDLGVSSQAGSANVWVTDDPQAVIDQEEELAQLDSSEAVIPPEYRDTVTQCVPALRLIGP